MIDEISEELKNQIKELKKSLNSIYQNIRTLEIQLSKLEKTTEIVEDNENSIEILVGGKITVYPLNCGEPYMAKEGDLFEFEVYKIRGIKKYRCWNRGGDHIISVEDFENGTVCFSSKCAT